MAVPCHIEILGGVLHMNCICMCESALCSIFAVPVEPIKIYAYLTSLSWCEWLTAAQMLPSRTA